MEETFLMVVSLASLYRGDHHQGQKGQKQPNYNIWHLFTLLPVICFRAYTHMPEKKEIHFYIWKEPKNLFLYAHVFYPLLEKNGHVLRETTVICVNLKMLQICRQETIRETSISCELWKEIQTHWRLYDLIFRERNLVPNSEYFSD